MPEMRVEQFRYRDSVLEMQYPAWRRCADALSPDAIATATAAATVSSCLIPRTSRLSGRRSHIYRREHNWESQRREPRGHVARTPDALLRPADRIGLHDVRRPAAAR